MHNIEVKAEHTYGVHIGGHYQAALEEISSSHERVLLIANPLVFDRFSIKNTLANLANIELCFTQDGEAQKSVLSVEELWKRCGEAGLTRSDAIVGLGGGATTDVSGFVAATWLRGIDWYAIPTTLAAMVDASVGGKTGINSSAGKNLIGSFHSPRSVFIDLQFLEALLDRDFAAGLAEVIKTGFIADRDILTILEHRSNLSEARSVAEELISRSIAVKARVVSEDFKESKLREVLNYGHTLGHAIEKFHHYEMRHGESISVGLVFAAELSGHLAGLSAETIALHRQLLQQYGLPITSSVPFAPLLDLMHSDKKSRGSRLRFIGLNSIGNPTWLEDVKSHDLEAVYEKIHA